MNLDITELPSLPDLGMMDSEVLELVNLASTKGGGLVAFGGFTGVGKSKTFEAFSRHVIGSGAEILPYYILSEDLNGDGVHEEDVSKRIKEAVDNGARFIGIDGYVDDPENLRAAFEAADKEGVLVAIVVYLGTDVRERLLFDLFVTTDNSSEAVEKAEELLDRTLIGFVNQKAKRNESGVRNYSINVFRGDSLKD